MSVVLRWLRFGSRRWPLHSGIAPARTLAMGSATPVGFEPTRGDPIGLAGRRLNHSAKVSLRTIGRLWLVCPCLCGRRWGAFHGAEFLLCRGVVVSSWVHSSVVRAADCRSACPWFKSGCALFPLPVCFCNVVLVSKHPATRNRTRDHLIAAGVYSQMLYQLSYSRCCFSCRHAMLVQSVVVFWRQHGYITWTHWGLNPGPPAC